MENFIKTAFLDFLLQFCFKIKYDSIRLVERCITSFQWTVPFETGPS